MRLALTLLTLGLLMAGCAGPDGPSDGQTTTPQPTPDEPPRHFEQSFDLRVDLDDRRGAAVFPIGPGNCAWVHPWQEDENFTILGGKARLAWDPVVPGQELQLLVAGERYVILRSDLGPSPRELEFGHLNVTWLYPTVFVALRPDSNETAYQPVTMTVAFDYVGPDFEARPFESCQY